ncbi:ATP-grasp domain-containing protein [Paenibacillus elgii]|uniref:ATP-grasp domain-containing protein n=1 Tax=Paenibacillus elgii TaxID=189691 RepID=UPI0021D53B2F|nr:ATP-grasp domain-containing protein [Paenibacillus elgii]
MRKALFKHSIITPEIDYPEELRGYLGRKAWNSKLSIIANNPENWNVFIKPVEDKKFTGVVVRSTKDLIGCGTYGEDPEILCSEVVNFVAEWRCFVRYGRILDIRRYRGDWRVQYDHKVVEDVVKEYRTAPKGYAVDFGLTDKGQTLLIEVNDGYSLGYYGLFSLDYAKLLSARWAELTNTIDECDF